MVQAVKKLFNSAGSCVDIVIIPLFEDLSVLFFEDYRVFFLNDSKNSIFDVDENVLRCVLMQDNLLDDLGSEQGHILGLIGFIFIRVIVDSVCGIVFLAVFEVDHQVMDLGDDLIV
jgi:hypothetical protein